MGRTKFELLSFTRKLVESPKFEKI